MKTTFLYFRGMFENPAPVVKSCKQNINLKCSTFLGTPTKPTQ